MFVTNSENGGSAATGVERPHAEIGSRAHDQQAIGKNNSAADYLEAILNKRFLVERKHQIPAPKGRHGLTRHVNAG